jgi:hypothetical protein
MTMREYQVVIVGVSAALPVHAKDEEARNLYQKFDSSVPHYPMHLFVRI